MNMIQKWKIKHPSIMIRVLGMAIQVIKINKIKKSNFKIQIRINKENTLTIEHMIDQPMINLNINHMIDQTMISSINNMIDQTMINSISNMIDKTMIKSISNMIDKAMINSISNMIDQTMIGLNIIHTKDNLNNIRNQDLRCNMISLRIVEIQMTEKIIVLNKRNIIHQQRTISKIISKTIFRTPITISNNQTTITSLKLIKSILRILKHITIKMMMIILRMTTLNSL